ncbi:sulfurtransferase [Rhodococcus chondri]|uniref:Rhodanese-like domain-containing protein n=1 Tax=Rhodococcus chondri TaxID=3065941 RepID=A0ABU7JVZ7_9NOCA|nr:rhodanese-like domain-containing protein [Rhodococcus sp. CC-R104]MEE2034208.1 rhodanese-like domain-containing protein [Rhodococcus sp. CC-R104]
MIEESSPLIGADELAGNPGAYAILDATVSFPKPRFDGDYRPESGYASWERAHLPGSAHADLLGDFSAPDTALHFTRPAPEQLAAALARLGVEPHSEIVVYDHGAMTWAARLWWMLRNVGVRARVLDGGLERWTSLGLPVGSGRGERGPGAETRTDLVDHGLWRDRDDVLAVGTGSAPGTLVCALDPEQFAGTATTRYARRGHIPGSRNLPAKSLLDAGVLRPVPQLVELTDAALPGAERPLVLYCGGGVSACLAALALVQSGHDGVAVYDGSLEEWAADPALPMISEGSADA